MERVFLEGKHMSVFQTVWKDGIIEGIFLPKQCHGDMLTEVKYSDDPPAECDALITQNHDVALGIRTADCAPICWGDASTVGIAHIGWRGLCLGLIEKMLARFDRENLEMFVGPHLHSFEIQKDFCYEAIAAKFGEQFFSHENGKIIFRFKDAIASLLPSSVVFDPRNTATDLTLPSWRRGDKDRRIITVVRFRK